ncbi:hypothetical protein Tco_0209730 [Tanacetum coccineum]
MDTIDTLCDRNLSSSTTQQLSSNTVIEVNIMLRALITPSVLKDKCSRLALTFHFRSKHSRWKALNKVALKCLSGFRRSCFLGLWHKSANNWSLICALSIYKKYSSFQYFEHLSANVTAVLIVLQDIACDAINFGHQSLDKRELFESLVAAAQNNGNSHILHVKDDILPIIPTRVGESSSPPPDLKNKEDYLQWMDEIERKQPEMIVVEIALNNSAKVIIYLQLKMTYLRNIASTSSLMVTKTLEKIALY